MNCPEFFPCHCFPVVCYASLYFCQFIWWCIKNWSKDPTSSSSVMYMSKVLESNKSFSYFLHEFIIPRQAESCPLDLYKVHKISAFEGIHRAYWAPILAFHTILSSDNGSGWNFIVARCIVIIEHRALLSPMGHSILSRRAHLLWMVLRVNFRCQVYS